MLFVEVVHERVELFEEDIGHVLALLQLDLRVFWALSWGVVGLRSVVLECLWDGQRDGLVLLAAGGGLESLFEVFDVRLRAQVVQQEGDVLDGQAFGNMLGEEARLNSIKYLGGSVRADVRNVEGWAVFIGGILGSVMGTGEQLPFLLVSEVDGLDVGVPQPEELGSPDALEAELVSGDNDLNARAIAHRLVLARRFANRFAGLFDGGRGNLHDFHRLARVLRGRPRRRGARHLAGLHRFAGRGSFHSSVG